MDERNGKGQTIFLSVIGIATLLVAIVGATFAWFSANVSGTPSVMSVTTVTLGTVVFTDGADIKVDNWYPGDSTNKEFSIAADDDATVATDYTVSLVYTSSFVQDQLKYNLTPGATGETAGTTGTIGDKTTDQTVPEASAEAVLPIGTGTLPAGHTHAYTFVLRFPELQSNQNANQGKSFNGIIRVQTEEAARYTSGGVEYVGP